VTDSVERVTRLHELHDRFGQSPWLDNLERRWLTSGELVHWIEQGVRGITSNPTIFAKAMASSDAYDDQLRQLLAAGLGIRDAYWHLAVKDVGDAADVLLPVFQADGGGDGFVSIEVDPTLANRTDETVEAALGLHRDLNRPNVLIKVPATAEGVPAIRRLTAQGISVNVTLIFGLDRYEDVMEAYLAGLEELVGAGGDPSRVASVASFFVSRVDTEVDARLESIGTEAALGLRGKAAIANAQVAYQRFLRRFGSDERWQRLSQAGGRLQRPLWASTSTKNPNYPDTMYVDALIGPNTVDTLPESTLHAFLDHGHLARTIDADPAGAQRVLVDLSAVGVDLDDVALKLEHEGVASFSKSFEEVLSSLGQRAELLRR
jgi:transaldolase